MPILSVVIPAYNEEKKIGEAIRKVDAYLRLKGDPWELLIMTDGSSDGTNRVVEEVLRSRSDLNAKLLIENNNHGKGYAVRQGVLTASGRYILLTDTDLSTPIKEVDKLIHALESGADVAIGSRAIRKKGVDVQQSFKRHLSGRIFNFFVTSIVMKGFRDTQCGFKCFKKDAAHLLFKEQKLDGYAFDVEVLYLARRRGLRIEEVPVMWKEGKDSRVRLLRDSYRMVRDLLKIKRLHP